ncbi:saccharopine dehydrogenase NADP-binding domain-containing protein [Solirubrobacter taibaiensis]|nr:saccharopine dehydrogenase NADP-binding domain-containing protein [Solirubrobacter taibaiensis]
MSAVDQPSWLIYGSNGQTGGLLAREAVRRGLQPVLAGRDASAVNDLADSLGGLETRVFGLDSPRLDGVRAVIHCAGPFADTARPMLDACLHERAHYIDVTGEIDVLEHVLDRDAECRSAGIVALPGAGFDVVPSDCLVALLKRDLPDASRLELVVGWSGGTISPGTLRSLVKTLRLGGRACRGGRVVRAPLGRPVRLPGLNGRSRTLLVIPWGDVATAYRSTGIPDVTTFLEADRPLVIAAASVLLRGLLRVVDVEHRVPQLAGRLAGANLGVEAPNESATLWARATAPSGRAVARRMTTPGRYATTAHAALACLEGVLAGTVSPGAHTPSQAFGADFALSLERVVCDRV